MLVICLNEDITRLKSKYDEYKTSANAAVFADVYKYLIYKCHISDKKVLELCYFCQMIYASYYDRWLFECDGESFKYPNLFYKLKQNTTTTDLERSFLNLMLDPMKVAVIKTVVKVYSPYDVKTLRILIEQEMIEIGDLTIDNVKKHYVNELE